MKCWSCGAEQAKEKIERKLSFRAACEKCCVWLHCCKNCKNYKPGFANDCLVPGTESISNREAMNFCEDFELLGLGVSKKIDPNEVFRRLFGD